jgi:hypothetical protein
MEGSNQLTWLIFIGVLGVAAFMFYTGVIKERLLERAYREALLNLRRNRHSPDARMKALRAGTALYGMGHSDGKPTIFEQGQINKEIQEATGEVFGQDQLEKPVVKAVTRNATEYRNIR